jgi:hypothetical protein
VVDFPGLADAAARALDLAGELEEVVPGRIWYLGKATMAGRSREVFLAQGLTWANAPRVLGGCGRLNAARAAVVFVPGAEPQTEIWKGDPPSVVSMKTVAGLGSDGQLELDRNHLESILSEGRRKAPIKAQKSFPTPAGAKWRDIMMTVTDTHVTVEANRKSREFSFAEAGFEERRKKGAPDCIWVLLKVFGMRGGVLPFTDHVLDLSTRINLKQYVTVVRKRLRALIPGIDSDPIPYDKDERCYRTAFKIASQEMLRFPTPEGTSWAKMSITLLREDAIRITVPEITRSTESAHVLEQGTEVQQWETAERETELGTNAEPYLSRSLKERGSSNVRTTTRP